MQQCASRVSRPLITHILILLCCNGWGPAAEAQLQNSVAFISTAQLANVRLLEDAFPHPPHLLHATLLRVTAHANQPLYVQHVSLEGFVTDDGVTQAPELSNGQSIGVQHVQHAKWGLLNASGVTLQCGTAPIAADTGDRTSFNWTLPPLSTADASMLHPIVAALQWVDADISESARDLRLTFVTDATRFPSEAPVDCALHLGVHSLGSGVPMGHDDARTVLNTLTMFDQGYELLDFALRPIPSMVVPITITQPGGTIGATTPLVVLPGLRQRISPQFQELMASTHYPHLSGDSGMVVHSMAVQHNDKGRGLAALLHKQTEVREQFAKLADLGVALSGRENPVVNVSDYAVNSSGVLSGQPALQVNDGAAGFVEVVGAALAGSQLRSQPDGSTPQFPVRHNRHQQAGSGSSASALKLGDPTSVTATTTRSTGVSESEREAQFGSSNADTGGTTTALDRGVHAANSFEASDSLHTFDTLTNTQTSVSWEQLLAGAQEAVDAHLAQATSFDLSDRHAHPHGHVVHHRGSGSGSGAASSEESAGEAFLEMGDGEVVYASAFGLGSAGPGLHLPDVYEHEHDEFAGDILELDAAYPRESHRIVAGLLESMGVFPSQRMQHTAGEERAYTQPQPTGGETEDAGTTPVAAGESSDGAYLEAATGVSGGNAASVGTVQAVQAYLTAHQPGLKQILGPIVGKTMEPVTAQLMPTIGSQMIDGVGSGSPQALKAETPGDVAWCVNLALTANLTNLLTDAVTSLTAEPLSGALASQLAPHIGDSIMAHALSTIHDHVTSAILPAPSEHVALPPDIPNSLVQDLAAALVPKLNAVLRESLALYLIPTLTRTLTAALVPSMTTALDVLQAASAQPPIATGAAGVNDPFTQHPDLTRYSAVSQADAYALWGSLLPTDQNAIIVACGKCSGIFIGQYPVYHPNTDGSTDMPTSEFLAHLPPAEPAQPPTSPDCMRCHAAQPAYQAYLRHYYSEYYSEYYGKYYADYYARARNSTHQARRAADDSQEAARHKAEVEDGRKAAQHPRRSRAEQLQEEPAAAL